MCCCMFHVGCFFNFIADLYGNYGQFQWHEQRQLKLGLCLKFCLSDTIFVLFFSAKHCCQQVLAMWCLLFWPESWFYSSFSLEESSMALEEWLSAQEEKVKEINKDDTELENVYKTLLMQRYWIFWSKNCLLNKIVSFVKTNRCWLIFYFSGNHLTLWFSYQIPWGRLGWQNMKPFQKPVISLAGTMHWQHVSVKWQGILRDFQWKDKILKSLSRMFLAGSKSLRRLLIKWVHKEVSCHQMKGLIRWRYCVKYSFFTFHLKLMLDESVPPERYCHCS